MEPGQSGGRSQRWGLSMTLMPREWACFVTPTSRSSLSPKLDAEARNQRKLASCGWRWKPKGVTEIHDTPRSFRRRRDRSEASEPYPAPGRMAWA